MKVSQESSNCNFTLMIQKAQDRMKQQTPEKERRFIVSEEVLCRDSAKESWYSRKLEPK